MRTPKLRGPGFKNSTIIMTGGINQSVSNLELQPGDLFDCINYEELDGVHYGYRSTDGYERWDGEHLASSVPLVKDYDTVPPTVDDTARRTEWQLVTTIPAAQVTSEGILGYIQLDGKHYVIRSNGTILKMYKLGATAITEIAGFTALAIPDTESIAHVSYGSFAQYPSYANKKVAIICTGNSKGLIMRSDETFALLNHATITGNGNPRMSYTFNERLFLAFEEGVLSFSGAGEPENYDPVTDLAGEYYLGDDINDMITAPNMLIVFCANSIHIISKTDVNLVTGVDMAKELFNAEEGALRGTVQKILGLIVYASREGIVTMDTTANYGDFEQVALSRNVQKTYDLKKSLITTSSVVRDKTQYRLYFSDGYALALTFDVEKRVKGATILRYNVPVNFIYEDLDNVAYFCTGSGYLMRRSIDAQSFDDNLINSVLKTAYYHYKAPVNNKVFHRVLVEIDAEAGTTISFRPKFNYETSNPALLQDIDMTRGGGIWNVDEWGDATDGTVTAVWGIGGIVKQAWLYINGIGTNMSLNFSTSTKHYRPHTIHNAIVTYNMATMDY